MCYSRSGCRPKAYEILIPAKGPLVPSLNANLMRGQTFFITETDKMEKAYAEGEFKRLFWIFEAQSELRFKIKDDRGRHASMILLIHSSGQAAFATGFANKLKPAEVFVCSLEENIPAGTFQLIIPLLDEGLLRDWEESPLGEWAMEAMEDPSIRMIPLLLEDCDWNESLFFGLPIIPHVRVPVLNQRFWTEEDALEQVASDLEKEVLPPAKQQKGGFKRAALRLLWHSTPTRYKWALGLALSAIITAIALLA
ncbi:MAG: hypothetical protein R3B47_00360 [Bacteroidia bacterium]